MDTIEKLFKIKFCNYFYSNAHENIASLAVVRLLLGIRNIVDKGQTDIIFTRVIKGIM